MHWYGISKSSSITPTVSRHPFWKKKALLAAKCLHTCLRSNKHSKLYCRKLRAAVRASTKPVTHHVLQTKQGSRRQKTKPKHGKKRTWYAASPPTVVLIRCQPGYAFSLALYFSTQTKDAPDRILCGVLLRGIWWAKVCTSWAQSFYVQKDQAANAQKQLKWLKKLPEDCKRQIKEMVLRLLADPIPQVGHQAAQVRYLLHLFLFVPDCSSYCPHWIAPTPMARIIANPPRANEEGRHSCSA